MTRVVAEFGMPEPKEKRDARKARQKRRRWHVEYDLTYDGGGGPWTGYYHFRMQAYIMLIWNRFIASYGGSVRVLDTKRPAR